MANMSPNKVPMPEQLPNVRNKNFDEVTKGYTKDMAIEEAGRCLNCKNKPCVSGCPVSVDIPGFITEISKGNFDTSFDIINESNSLPAICGRVCPQESQCESKCVRAIKGESVAIGRLERFAADLHLQKENTKSSKSSGKKVAVIGAGPAGLTCAGALAKLNYSVTIFEAFHTSGGVLMYGIPQFRLPKDIVRKEIDALKSLGVNIETNTIVGKSASIADLFEEGFEAVFIGSGAGLPTFLNIPGENLNCVYSANEFLTRINLMRAYEFPTVDTPVRIGQKVAVIGGGNVAMDAARCAKRLGADEVCIIYRRSENELPARLEEIHHAKEEGILFHFLTNPIRIVGNEEGWVSGVECVKMDLGETDSSGRRRPQEIPESNFTLDMDTVIIAIGQTPNPLIKSTTEGLYTMPWGGIVADETGKTSIEGVYAGGDAVTGAATVILAMGAGKTAANSIHEYLTNK